VARLTRLRALRKRKVLTQKELAQRAGLTRRGTVLKIEAGQTEPYPRTVRKLAKALGVQPRDLMEPQP
jgi:transcriptional regulator with XRE-family HTH domain